MYVPFSIKVPLKLAADIQARLELLQADLRAGIVKLDTKIKTGKGNPKKLSAVRSALTARRCLLTAPNMLRIALMHGMPAVISMTDDEVFEHLTDTGIKRGRPRAA